MMQAAWKGTYTCTFFNSTLAFAASVGNNRTESAASPATKMATLVKKPKTACARVRAECIFFSFLPSLRVWFVQEGGSESVLIVEELEVPGAGRKEGWLVD